MEQKTGQDEVADGSEQNPEEEQTLLSTEAGKRAWLLKTAYYVDIKCHKNGKKLSQQIKGINYILTLLEINLICKKIWQKVPWKPQNSLRKCLKQFQSKLKKLKNQLETGLVYWLM